MKKHMMRTFSYCILGMLGTAGFAVATAGAQQSDPNAPAEKAAPASDATTPPSPAASGANEMKNLNKESVESPADTGKPVMDGEKKPEMKPDDKSAGEKSATEKSSDDKGKKMKKSRGKNRSMASAKSDHSRPERGPRNIDRTFESAY